MYGSYNRFLATNAWGGVTKDQTRYDRGITAYKLFRVRKDGTLGPLFIGREIVIEPHKIMQAENRPTKGFKVRPGWHACAKQSAPPKKGRVWCKVTLWGVTEHQRPESQGGLWYTAAALRVDEVLN